MITIGAIPQLIDILPKVVEAGLTSKLLLVICSCCNPVLKQKSFEFLKMCIVVILLVLLFLSVCLVDYGFFLEYL